MGGDQAKYIQPWRCLGRRKTQKVVLLHLHSLQRTALYSESLNTLAKNCPSCLCSVSPAVLLLCPQTPGTEGSFCSSSAVTLNSC